MNAKLFCYHLEKKVIVFTEKEESMLSTTLPDNYLLEAILQLPKKYRTIIFLYYYEEYKINEISEILSVSVNILNKYADEGYVLAFQEGIDATSDKIIYNSYKSDNLNTNIVVYTNDWSKERLAVSFVYDDILYQFIEKNISKDEMAYKVKYIKQVFN